MTAQQPPGNRQIILSSERGLALRPASLVERTLRDLDRFEEVDRRLASNIDAVDEHGFTRLHRAAQDGVTAEVQSLLAKGANPNVRAKSSVTPLLIALSWDREEMAHILLNAGADPNAANENGYAPLHTAASHGHFDLVRTLIERGANVNATSEVGFTPLYMAARNGFLPVVDVLIATGADINAKSITLADWEAITGITNGPDTNLKNVMGDTPLDGALKNGQTEIADLLRQHGAKRGHEVGK